MTSAQHIQWKPIATMPEDRKCGQLTYVKRMHEGRLVAEGWAVFGEWHPSAEYVQPDPDIPNRDVAGAMAERRWLRPDRMYAFPGPTHWADIKRPE